MNFTSMRNNNRQLVFVAFACYILTGITVGVVALLIGSHGLANYDNEALLGLIWLPLLASVGTLCMTFPASRLQLSGWTNQKILRSAIVAPILLLILQRVSLPIVLSLFAGDAAIIVWTIWHILLWLVAVFLALIVSGNTYGNPK
jgi:hypothetical protein